MFLQIDGWRGAGKSALWTLLDGHKDVFCSPVHDTSFEGFMDEYNESEWIKNKNIRKVRSLLSTTGYYKLEVFSHAKVFYMDFSAESNRLAIPFDLDFYRFDKLFIETLVEADEWTIEFVIETLYSSLRKVYNKNRNVDTPKYNVAMGAPKLWENSNYHELLSNGKCIQVRRDIEGILATISNRRANPLDKSSQSGYSKSFEHRIRNHEIEKIKTYYDNFDNLKKEYPNKYLIVDFKKIIEETDATMRKVANFLDIDFNPILTVATRDGEELICNGKKYVGEVYDDPTSLLTKSEKKKIKRRRKLHSFHKQRYFPLSFDWTKMIVKDLLRLFYSKA